MFCPKCGKQFPDTAKFCPKCGNVVTKSISTQPKEPEGAGEDNLFRKKSPGSSYVPPSMPGAKETGYSQYFGILLAVLAGIIIVGAAFYFLKPKLFPEEQAPRMETNEELTDKMIAHPEDFVDYNEKKNSSKSEKKVAKADAEKEVRDLADTLVTSLEHYNYTKFYTAMTPELHKWIQNYYANVKDSGMYADARRLGDIEPATGDYMLGKELDLKGPRAEMGVLLKGPVQGADVNVEYIFIFVNKEGAWQLDGMPGGPGGEGPIVKRADVDFDGDGENETLAFYGDLTHRAMRWEVLSAAGEQKYVFELPACGAGSEDPAAEAAAQDAVRAVAAKQTMLRVIGGAEQKVIIDTFPNLKDSMLLRQAVEQGRSGFIMQDGCGGNGFLVFELKGSYMEVQAPPPPKQSAALKDDKAAKPQKPKHPATR